MSAAAANLSLPDPPDLRRRLARVCARERSLLALRGALALVATAAILALIDLLLDWSLDLPGAVRVAVLVGNVVVMGIVARKLLARAFSRFSALRMALRVEKMHPRLQSVLVSAVQFASDPAPAPGVSESLMRAVRADAARATEAIDFATCAPVRRVPAAAGAAAIALGGVLLVGFLSPTMLGVLAQRMLNPFSQVTYPTRTTVELVGGDRTLLLGRPVELSARASGEVPDEATLCLRADGAGWESLPVARGADGLFTYHLPEVRAAMDYYFLAGDGRSATARIRVETPPRVVRTEALLTYPDYLRTPPQASPSLNLHVPEGTAIHWTLRFDRPVESAEMEMQGQDSPSVRVAPDQMSAEADAPAMASGSYQFQLRWRFTGEELVEPAAKHFLRVVPDDEPRVIISYPLDDEKATLHKTLTVRYVAADDHGLSAATLIYAINDGTEQRRDLGELGGEPNAERELRWKVTDDLPDLREGDLMTYSVEVRDGRPGEAAAAFGRSQSRRVQFVSTSEYLLYALAQERRYLGQIRPLYMQELEAAGAVRRLAPPGTGPSTLDPEGDELPTQPASGPAASEAP
jgi:uncharacterized membrane protein YidH (DUF202 family)